MRILLVEDLLMARMAAEQLLKKLGCEVTSAEDGATALALAQSEHFDLIFMDIGLPDITGFEVTENIRKLPAPYGTVIIVALTAHDDEENRARSIETGMQGFYTKPLTSEMVQNVFNEFNLNL